MNNGFLVSKQTQAEKDQYLIECFYDANFIDKLLEGRYSILAGRKGAGKTALARYLQKKYEKHNVFFSSRISVDEISYDSNINKNVETLLFYIIIQTIKLIIDKDFMHRNAIDYWKDFLESNGLQNVENYKAFTGWAKERFASVKIKGFGMGQSGNYKRTTVSDSAVNLFHAFKESIIEGIKVIIFIDDLTDYLDRTKREEVLNQIDVIRDLLLRLDKLNTALQEDDKDLCFISCIRDDLFDYMKGSNINKLESNTLKINWNEKNFSCLLIKRLPHFQGDLKKYLESPNESIKGIFPDKIFTDYLKNFDTKRYHTNFYAYMVAITFNRPRDFLKYCYCMRNRLSFKESISEQSIESTENEYSDYFIRELKDELFLSSQILKFESDIDGIHKLISKLSKNEYFSFGQLKTEIASFLNTRASNKLVKDFIKNLWLYGIIGHRFSQMPGIINFKYIDNSLYLSLDADLSNLDFYLHRGMLWAYKRKTAFYNTTK